MIVEESLGPCLWCEEPVLPSERHEKRAVVEISGAVIMPVHGPCAARIDFGSVGHQRKRCSCFGGTEEDPPGLSRRRAAEAAEIESLKKEGFGGW